MIKAVVTAIASLGLAGGTLAPADGREMDVREAVRAFYAAFNAHDFEHAAEYTTLDWEHINPFGGWTRGREDVLKELRQVHGTFLRGVTDTPDTISVRFINRIA